MGQWDYLNDLRDGLTHRARMHVARAVERQVLQREQSEETELSITRACSGSQGCPSAPPMELLVGVGSMIVT